MPVGPCAAIARSLRPIKRGPALVLGLIDEFREVGFGVDERGVTGSRDFLRLTLMEISWSAKRDLGLRRVSLAPCREGPGSACR